MDNDVVRIIMQYGKGNDHAIDENCEEQVSFQIVLYIIRRSGNLAVYLENSL